MIGAINENNIGGGSSGGSEQQPEEQGKEVAFEYTELEDGTLEITKLDFSNCDFSVGYYEDYEGGSVNTIFRYFEIKLINNTLEIPSQIDGKTVKKVNVNSIKLPSEDKLGTTDNYTHNDIKESKFKGGPITITFGNTIEEINCLFNAPIESARKHGYNFLASARNINLPNSLKIIGENAFRVYGDTRSVVTSNIYLLITVPASVESIGNNAFNNKSDLSQSAMGEIIVKFDNGLNSNLTIPEDKWGASKITVNGVNQ